ncbi:MAG: hypothetical protein GPOALKHO_001025 [Sodalis sp.]|nr:MAG: hypothetical protein GPOALKHO_001025 [Sodalis sp.]
MAGDFKLVAMGEDTVKLQTNFAEAIAGVALRPASLTAFITGHCSPVASSYYSARPYTYTTVQSACWCSHPSFCR